MQFPTPSGNGRAIVNGCLQDISWQGALSGNDGAQVTLSNGQEIELEDYDDRLDFHFTQNSDGSLFYQTMVLLEAGESDPALIPTADELKQTAHADLAPLYDAVMSQELDPDDLRFGRLLFTSPDCMLRVTNKYGSVAKGREAIVAFLLKHTPPL